jgi:hypothetical protein
MSYSFIITESDGNKREDVFVTDPDQAVSRTTIINLGGKIIATRKHGSEVTKQLWLVQSRDDDTYWIGDDWYDNNFARVFLAHLSPF